MIIIFNVRVLDCIDRPLTEMEKDPKGPMFYGSISIKKEKKTKTGVTVQLEDIQSFKSFEKISAGEHMVEAVLAPYSVNGNNGISLKILKIIKPKI